LIAAGRKGIEEYERAAPDRLTPFLREAISKREGGIKDLRDSNINQALIRAGLEIADKGIIKGAGKGLDAYQQGAKDIRQSEDALMESRAKMAQAQTLFDQNKLGAAQKAREEAARLNELAIKKGDSDNAQIYRTLELEFKGRQADAAERRAQFEEQTLPAKISLLEAQAEALRNRPTGLDKTIATQDQITKARINAIMALSLDKIDNPTDAQLQAAIDAQLSQSGLRRIAGEGIQLPPPVNRGDL
jgi:DNA polymerase III delta prime subunit